jgi:hypothetical protein
MFVCQTAPGRAICELYDTGELIMSKSHDAKKTEKKVASKTPKEKKEAKKLKKDASKRQ